MAHLFISYRKKDRDQCDAIRQRLENAGYEVWSDAEIPPGEAWGAVLEERLRSASAIITLWTERSVRSKWVYFETLMATEMGKSVALQFGKCEIPYGLHYFQKLSYDPSWSADSTEWRGILDKIDGAIERGRESTSSGRSLDTIVWDKIKSTHDAQDLKDFIDRYPSSEHVSDAQACLAERERKDSVRRSLWWSFGLFFYLMLALPFITLMVDYDAATAEFFASLYFPFFGVFLIFGPMMIPIYLFTLDRALRFGMNEGFAFAPRSLRSRAATLIVLVIGPIITCATVATLEVRDGYAPWQFTSEILDAPLAELARDSNDLVDITEGPDIREDRRTLRQVFEASRQFTFRSLLESRDGEFDTLPCLASPSSTGTPMRLVSDPNCVTHMNNIQRVMERVHDDPAANSYTSYAYQYGFFFFTLAFMGTYFNIFALTIRAEKARVWMARLSPWSGQRYGQLLQLLSLQLFFISIWFVARMLFQLQTGTILPSSGQGQFTQVIRNSYFLFFAIYLVAIGGVVRAAFRFRNRYAQVGVVLTAVMTAAMMALAFSLTSFCRMLQQFVGIHATTESTIVLGIFLFFIIFFPLILPNLAPAKETDLGN